MCSLCRLKRAQQQVQDRIDLLCAVMVALACLGSLSLALWLLTFVTQGGGR